MQLLANYLKEREGYDSLITDEGFAVYKIMGQECYIKDIYVHPDYRKKGVASELADAIAEIAKQKGCKTLIGSVSTDCGNPTDSTKVLLAYGMTITAAIHGGILFKKGIE